MALKHYAYAYLTDLPCDIVRCSANNNGAIIPEYDPETVPGTLRDCAWNRFELTHANGSTDIDEVEFAMWPMVRINTPEGQTIRSRFIYSDYAANYVITVDESEVGNRRYRCPVCGQDDKGFETLPAAVFVMDKRGAAFTSSGTPQTVCIDTDCNCIGCGFQGHIGAFDTDNWNEYTGRVE